MDNDALQAILAALYGTPQTGATPGATQNPSAQPRAAAPMQQAQQAPPAGVIAPGVGVNYTNQQPKTKMLLGSMMGGSGGGGGSSC